MIAPTTTTRASTRASARPNPAAATRARRPEHGRPAHGDRERTERQPVVRGEKRGERRRGQPGDQREVRAAQREPARGRRAPQRPPPARPRGARVPSAQRTGRGRTTGTAPRAARTPARPRRARPADPVGDSSGGRPFVSLRGLIRRRLRQPAGAFGSPSAYINSDRNRTWFTQAEGE